MENKTSRTRLIQMAQLAILIAIMFIFAFSPLGYLKIGLIEITFMVLPVAIGAIILGPAAGAVLGAVFGLTSFIQCFGMSTFGVFLLSLNPILTFITCMVPRVLCGWFSGVLFRAMQKFDKTRVISYFVASLSTALLNTLFFMTAIVVFFWHNDSFIATMTEWKLPTDSLWIFLVTFVGLNGVVEAIANTVLGGAIAKAVSKAVSHFTIKRK